MRDRSVRALNTLLVLTVLASSATARAMPTDPEAKAHLDKGNALYGKGEYEAAVEEYRKGYAKQDDPAFLYTWAQAERKRGRCAAAVKLYQRYLATNPPEVSADYARDGILKCADELASDEPLPPGDDSVEPATDPTAEPEPAPEPAPEPVPEPRADRPKWPRDPAAIALVAVGTAGLGAGIGLLAVASVEKNKDAATYGEFDDQQKKVKTFQIAGGVVLGVGIGLLAGGVARWMVLRAKEKRGPAVSAMIGRDLLGVSFSRRF